MKGYSTINVKSESAGLIAKVFLVRKRCQFPEIKETLAQSGLWKEAWQRITMRLQYKDIVRELGFRPMNALMFEKTSSTRILGQHTIIFIL
jgi:hypothetical protein